MSFIERTKGKILAFLVMGCTALAVPGCANECRDDAFKCAGDTARRCSGGRWVRLGTCRLGCDHVDQACYATSNLPLAVRETVGEVNLQSLDLLGAQSPVTINSDDGSITGDDGQIIRPAGEGYAAGIVFSVDNQGNDPAYPAGMFVMQNLNIPPGMELIGTGTRPLVLYLNGGADIYGTIDVGARQGPNPDDTEGYTIPGPGGFAGGGEEAPGLGPGGGGGGDGDDCSIYVTSGGGGGGHAGAGGAGGDGGNTMDGCPNAYPGGEGGVAYGSPELSPLVGGSGGGGGGAGDPGPSVPGEGGAGGGAVQLTALQYIHVYPGGVITAPGGGGCGAIDDGGGGGGGGAGGTILLEARDVILESGSVVAANGGGGGAGDKN